jgi:hypothetical protein
MTGPDAKLADAIYHGAKTYIGSPAQGPKAALDAGASAAPLTDAQQTLERAISKTSWYIIPLLVTAAILNQLDRSK